MALGECSCVGINRCDRCNKMIQEALWSVQQENNLNGREADRLRKDYDAEMRGNLELQKKVADLEQRLDQVTEIVDKAAVRLRRGDSLSAALTVHRLKTILDETTDHMQEFRAEVLKILDAYSGSGDVAGLTSAVKKAIEG